ncbi:hypothetical protein KHM83_02025 [Fusibacter paucivorans]|uniref:Uncharacterized protein n=1 Tax=Fusibacter paucivorans TaxID=76009 RepID=A0ABS5PLI3_9FIRM|nr:CC/Se motif family (seleno)protein [Fusibacter paucivorans]MBS7525451.1 hypothetical protein [Fusibacter paucivorans]
MQIEISEKAKNYLDKKKSNILTVGLVIAGACVEIGEPNVTIGEPKDDVSKYDVFNVENYTVYFYKNPSLKTDTVTIDTSKFLGMESLSVKGLKLM